MGARLRTLREQPESEPTQPLALRLDVLDLKADMVDARPALSEELTHRTVVSDGFEQLDAALADRVHRDACAGFGHVLSSLLAQAETGGAPEGRAAIEIRDGDADVMNALEADVHESSWCGGRSRGGELGQSIHSRVCAKGLPASRLIVMAASLTYPFAPRFSSRGVAGLVSVVLVHYRGAQDLRDCVVSLAEQDWPDVEVILVDNDSAEGLPGLDDLPSLRSRSGLSLRTLRLGRNEGFAGGANAGAGLARGEYIFFLNPDTVLQPGCIAALVSAEADIATARLLLASDPSLLDNCGHGLFPDGLNWCRGRGQSAAGRFLQSEDVLLFSGAAVLFTRSALVRTGGFDPSYFAYGEDADLSLRAARLGLRCRYVADACVHHKVGGSFGRLALRKVLLVERNRSRVALTHLPWSWLLASPWWTLRRHLALGRGAATGRGLAASWPSWQRPLLPMVVLGAHVVSIWDLPGNLRRRRALGGGMRADLLRPARVGVEEVMGRARVSPTPTR